MSRTGRTATALLRLACQMCLAGGLTAAPDSTRNATVTEPTLGHDEIMVLPTMVVRAESMAFADWSKTISPHFVVYSDHDPAEVRAILLHLEQLKAGLDQLAGLPAVPGEPMVFIYPHNRSDWNKLEGLDRKEEWTARVVCWGIDHRITQLRIVREPRWLGQLLLGDDPAVGFYAELGGDFSRSHNLPHSLWFNRGMAIQAAYAKVEPSAVIFGARNHREHHFGWHTAIPWERVFRADYGSPEYQKTQSVLQLDAQSSLAVSYFFTHQDPPLPAKLYAWLYHLDEGCDPDEAKFQELFGWNWAGWMQVIKDFQSRARKPRRLPLGVSPAALNPLIQRVELHAVEMRELFLLSQIAGGGTRHGGDLLDHVLQKGLKTESLRPLLASACLHENRIEPALAILRKLGREGSRNVRIYEEAARLLLTQAAPDPGPDARVATELGREIRSWCDSALALQPHTLAANDLLAWTIALDSQIGPQALEAIQLILQRQEAGHHTREIRAALALAAFRLGDTERARRICLDLTTNCRKIDRAATCCQQLLTRLQAGTVGGLNRK